MELDPGRVLDNIPKVQFRRSCEKSNQFLKRNIKKGMYGRPAVICLEGFVTFVYNIPTTTKAAEIHPNSTNQNSVRNQNKPIRSVSNQTKQNSQ